MISEAVWSNPCRFARFTVFVFDAIRSDQPDSEYKDSIYTYTHHKYRFKDTTRKVAGGNIQGLHLSRSLDCNLTAIDWQ